MQDSMRFQSISQNRSQVQVQLAHGVADGQGIAYRYESVLAQDLGRGIQARPLTNE